jgi:hypothetical protein
MSAAASTVPTERTHIKRLLTENLNYFGNLADSQLKPVKKIVANTDFEQLTCVGYNPDSRNLEATIAIKLPVGYGGDLCSAGSTEYVRFFVNYGGGWEDAGYTGARVHDIPNDKDCAGGATKPLTYVATLRYEPKARCCPHPVLPKVHAILSWQWIPPAGPANVGWLPPWGNAVECDIQIKPSPWNILCLIEEIELTTGQKIKVPLPVEAASGTPIPLPDPPPLQLGELAQLYTKGAGEAGSKRSAAAKVEYSVEPHRFGLTYLQSITSGGGFDQGAAKATSDQFAALGVDMAGVLAALDDTKANVTYEEVECLGLDEAFPERLVATFRVKKQSGYSGGLCTAGSLEYVAFWADWDNTCQWTYVGTAAVRVHDIKTIPAGGLCYSAILPVDLTYHRRSCKSPKIGRVRAVLSWATPPSTIDPDALNFWGNRIDTHVVINPGDAIDPNHPKAVIRNIGGIPVEDIATAGNGMTLPAPAVAQFAHYPWVPADQFLPMGAGRACPFGGRVIIEGIYYLGFFYRVTVRKFVDPPISAVALGTSFQVEKSTTGFDTQTSVGGFFAYLDPLTHFDRTLAVWDAPGDELFVLQLDIATAPNPASIIASSVFYNVLTDNTPPLGPPNIPLTMDIHIDGMGDCKDKTAGDTITGTFIADDLHFGGWGLSTEPNTFTTPSNPPAVSGLATTDPAPAPLGHAWSLDTAAPVQMKPCGYVVRLDVSDRTIRESIPGQHNSNHIEVGFCLRAKT